ncbi:ThiF family adenylyltransferase [uncultured Paludibaculum sp.]|uniref:ThiF family adenylyltransferase n=1 Tax=uncultured Paludibaculum sp. TaxID=1765020 RepID=UPI002AAB736A|nr:ThiF family adenylyltransferase [uncultured Paludibaculum sp.]
MTDSERDRYSRQILLPGIGPTGQQQLLDACVAVVGCGALGAFQAGALARAGVGHILLVDRDFVELSNLQRQWLYDESDARDALPKAVAAARAIGRINSGVRAESVVDDLTAANIQDHLQPASLILDGTDNFETRYLLNDFAVDRGIPWIYGGAVGTYGLAMPIVPGRSACFECIYPEPPSGAQPTCDTAGVLNTITSLVASWQVSLALRLLCGQAVEPRISTFDAWDGVVRQVAMPDADPECPACGGARTCRHLHGADRVPISLCGRNAVQIHDRRRPLDLEALAAALTPLGQVRSNGFALRFVVQPYEMTIFPDGRAIIKGTQDPGLARSLYSRYIGN